MTTTPDPFGELVRTAKGTRTNKEMARDMGGIITASRLQQYATGRIKAFPDPETINALAMAAGMSARDVTLAAASSLGVKTTPDPVADLVLWGAGTLPDTSKELLRSMASEMLTLHQETAADGMAS